MKIANCLKKYSDRYYEEMFGLSKTKAIDGFSRASKFLSDFALSTESYLQECVPKMQKVYKSIGFNEFDIRTSPACMMFQPDFGATLHVSSPMFSEETWLLIQKICCACGDHFLYIIEESPEDSAFQLKIPITASWERLQSGSYISTVLFSMPYNNYRIFGDSCSWGKWCDYENSWSDYEIFGNNLDIPEIRKYNEQMALPVDDYLYMKNNTGFPPNIRVISNVFLHDYALTDDRSEIKSKWNEADMLTLYVK